MEAASCVPLPGLPASMTNSGRHARFSKCHATRPSLDRLETLGESIAKGVSAFQGLSFRTTWLRSRHLTGDLYTCWALFTPLELPTAVKPVIRRSQMPYRNFSLAGCRSDPKMDRGLGGLGGNSLIFPISSAFISQIRLIRDQSAFSPTAC